MTLGSFKPCLPTLDSLAYARQLPICLWQL